MPDHLRFTDFRMAGFLLARDVAFVGAEVNPRGDVVFIFGNAMDPKAKDVVNQYPGSPEQKYDSACRTMHNLVKITKQSAGTGRVGDDKEEEATGREP